MKPRLPHSSREGTGAPSLRLAEAVSLQQEKQRFLFHSEPRCSRRLEGPPPSAVCRGMPAPPPPPPRLLSNSRCVPRRLLGHRAGTRAEAHPHPSQLSVSGSWGPQARCRVGALWSSQGEGPLRAQPPWARHGLASPGHVPAASAVHTARPCAGCVQGCWEHPGRGRPATVGGAGPSGPPWRAEPLLSSQGLPEGLPSPLPPRARALAPTAPGGGPPTRADSDGGTRPVPITWASADRRQGLASEKDRERGVCLPERGFPAASTARGPPAGRGGG